MELMHTLAGLPLQKQKESVRKLLISIGTDFSKYENDPFGNGDQSMIQSSKDRDTAREIFSSGGDIHGHFEHNGFSKFAMHCMLGLTKQVRNSLEDAAGDENDGQPTSHNNKLKKILEGRETELRLTPLLLIVSAGKDLMEVNEEHRVAVSKMLLRYGANPRAQDVLGKTVCHYGAGAMATSMTLRVAEMCIVAAKTSHMFGQEAELYNLKTVEMNGSKGIVGGYNVDTGRREIFLTETKKPIWVKPENIKVLGNPCKTGIMLADIQDRMGTVSLHEVVMADRVDVAKILLDKHNTSIHTKCMDGVNPASMATQGGMLKCKGVCSMIADISLKEGNVRRKQKKITCAKCGKGGDLSACARCKVTLYCSRECQTEHWKDGHKAECKKIILMQSGITIDPPQSPQRYSTMMSFQTGNCTSGSYRKPRGVRVNEKFVVKVQGGGEIQPLLVYDETRTCEFDISPGQSCFKIILEEIKKEPTWNGRKTFMKALFDESGKCKMFPTTAGVKEKYSW